MKPRGKAPRARERRSLDLEELARALPGGARPAQDAQSLLLRVLSYIDFLQNRIRDTHSWLIHSGNPRDLPYNANITPKRDKVTRQPRRPRKSRLKENCVAASRPRLRLFLHGHKDIEQRNPRDNAEEHSEGHKEQTELKSEGTIRQTLVPYLSPTSSDNGDVGTWLQSIPVSPGTDLPCSPNMSSTPATYLGLSPSLFSSPGDHLLHGESSQVLFEEVQLSSCSSPELQAHSLAKAFTLDHSYQSQSENSAGSAPCRDAPHNLQPHTKHIEEGETRRPLIKKERWHVSSDDSDTDFIPYVVGGVKGRKRKPNRFSQLQRLRKKCVNGFIMFCRLNRKPYLSAHPGMASTAATKELAELWRDMSVQERHPYCVKALKFSVLHDRLVKEGSAHLIQQDLSPLKPLSVLLAEKMVHSTMDH
ncbi:meiosis initiator protein [Pelodytes ibericus]